LIAWQCGSEVPEDAEVMATVGLGRCPEGGLGLEIALDITLLGIPKREAEVLIKMAHRVCPYSSAVRNNVTVKLALIAT
jgi:lipoyl-dependent peroxiredoxin